MHWTVRLETRTDQGEVTTTELFTFSRPAMVSALAEIGLTLAETKALLAKLQASVLCGQMAEYAAHHRVCPECGMLQSLKDRRTRRLQTLFGRSKSRHRGSGSAAAACRHPWRKRYSRRSARC